MADLGKLTRPELGDGVRNLGVAARQLQRAAPRADGACAMPLSDCAPEFSLRVPAAGPEIGVHCPLAVRQS